jgi:hypothetical protein
MRYKETFIFNVWCWEDYRMLFFSFCYSSLAIITLALSHHFQQPRKKKCGCSHSYFRTCNLVTFFIIVVSSETQRKLLQPYSRIFTCFVLSPTLQNVVRTLSKNMSVYTKTYEGNTHRVSACDTYINVLTLTEVFLTPNEVFPWFFLSCKAYARVKLAKTGHGPHSSTLVVICVVRWLFMLFYVMFVCKCVLPPCDNPIAVNKYIKININTRNVNKPSHCVGNLTTDP